MGPTAHGPIYRRAKKMIAFASPMVDNTAPNTRYFHHLNVDHNSWSSTLFVSAKFSRATKVIVQPRKDDAVRPCVGNTAQLVAHATTTNHIAAYVILEHKKRKRKRKNPCRHGWLCIQVIQMSNVAIFCDILSSNKRDDRTWRCSIESMHKSSTLQMLQVVEIRVPQIRSMYFTPT